MNVRPLIMVLTGGITALLSATASFGAPLEEIVTYAERRSSDVQDVPVAVSTFTSDEIDRRQITGTIDIIQNVPNMSGAHNVSLGGSNSYFLRGIGNAESIATFDVPIGTYIDEIYISRQNQNQVNLIDIDRLEVLRGPQGTLFGRNTTGGAVVVVSQKPTDEFFATVEASAGSYERYTLKGSVNAPVSDKLLTQFSVYGIDEDGWMDSVTTGETYNGEKALGVRGAMRFIPSDTVTWDLSMQYSDTEVQAIGVAASPVGSQIPITGDFTKNNTALGDCNGPVSDAQGITAPTCSFNKMKSVLVASNIEWQLDLFTLNFITGYYDLEQNYSADFLDNSPDEPFGPFFPISSFIIANNGNHDQISQEIKISGELSDNVRYVGGVFYMDEENTTIFTDWVDLPALVPLTVRTPLKNTTQSAAVYGQFDFDVTDQLTLLAGGRWTDEDKDFHINGSITDADLGAVLPEPIPLKQSETKFTYKVGGNYQFNDDVMAYLTYATGFKSGGWNARGSTPDALAAFGPEEVTSIEAGLRAEWFDNRLRTNVNVFRAEYDDIQIATVEEELFITTNAGDTQIDGLELELTGAATDNLTLYGNLGMMDGKYTHRSDGGIDANIGPEPTRMPEMTAMVGGDFTAPGEVFGGEIFLGGQVAWTDDYFMGNDNAPNTLIESHALVNAQVGWRNEALDVILECKNCFDETWFGTVLFNTLYPADPVRWNLRAKYRF